MVYVTEGMDRVLESRIEAEVQRLREEGLEITRIRSLPAEFSFMDLTKWRVLLSNTVDLEGVKVVGTDKRDNRIFLGLESESVWAGLSAKLAAAGVPTSAIRHEVVSVDLQYEDDLQGSFDRYQGGIEIRSEETVNGVAGLCTLGPVVVGKQNTNYGIYIGQYYGLTASHCTPQMAGVDISNEFRQPGDPYSPVMGWESIDAISKFPPGYHCPYSYHEGCRHSDVAMIRIPYGNPQEGWIARPKSMGGTTELFWGDHFSVTEVRSTRMNSGQVHMVGKSSGWQNGNIVDSCYDIRNYPAGGGNTLALICQTVADYVSVSGDSGAPIFTWDGNSAGDVTLVAFHIARLNVGSASYSVHSSTTAYYTDLGRLTDDPEIGPHIFDWTAY